MTVTTSSIEIAADPATVFRYASATERWPEFLPHYRWVRVLEDDGSKRVVEMAARRNWIPIRWTAEQTNDAARPHIAFRHLRGWTKGMEVQWLFEPRAGGTRVTIEHRLRFRFPFASEWLGRHLVSDFFIHYVAGRTLAHMKRLAEAAACTASS
ncbi:MAG: SRPBCC family protein [Candidatus Eremiobacteraeota bacterium]|nr:SRPBCC family protein [Candidatus Eremiobacteraeota bacterium]MBV8354251.1 SRPBCC family protein [Candidatus Eremiobacteraeota bacterium]